MKHPQKEASNHNKTFTMNTSEDSYIEDDTSLHKDLQRLSDLDDEAKHAETNTLLAVNATDSDGVSECNGVVHDNVAGSNTRQLDCLLLYPAEGDNKTYSGLEHHVSKQFHLIIQA